MDLATFSQDEKPFETQMDLDEYDEALDDGHQLDESSSSDDPDDDNAARAAGFGKNRREVFFPGRAYAGL